MAQTAPAFQGTSRQVKADNFILARHTRAREGNMKETMEVMKSGMEGNAVWGYFAAAAISAGFGMAIAAYGVAKGQSNALMRALDGIARQPESAKPMFVPLLLGLAFMEVLGLLTFGILFLVLNPLTQEVVKLVTSKH